MGERNAQGPAPPVMQHENLPAISRQIEGRGQTCRPRADDDDIQFRVRFRICGHGFISRRGLIPTDEEAWRSGQRLRPQRALLP